MNIAGAIEVAHEVCGAPIVECMAMYRYLLLSEQVEPLGDNEIGFKLSKILQHRPRIDLNDLSYNARELFTQFLFGKDNVPYEGAIGTPVVIIAHTGIPYGPPESSKLGFTASQDGELLNRILLERYNGRSIGFREVWNQVIQKTGVNKRRDPNVFIMAAPADQERAMNLVRAVITIGEPTFVLVIGDDSLFEKVKISVDHTKVPDLWLATPDTYSELKGTIHKALLTQRTHIIDTSTEESIKDEPEDG